MAIRSPKEVRPARIIAMIWVILTLGAAVLIGVLGKVYVENGMVAQNYVEMVNSDSEKNIYGFNTDHIRGL